MPYLPPIRSLRRSNCALLLFSVFLGAGLATAGCVDRLGVDGQAPDLVDIATADGISRDAADAADAADGTRNDDASAVCGADEDCVELDGCCTRGFCYQGTCQVSWLPDCCTTEGACAVSSVHYAGACDEPCGEGSCRKSLKLDEEDGCQADELFRFDPEADSVGALSLEDSIPGDSVTWHLSSRRGLTGKRALYAGDLLCATYHTGPLDGACKPVDVNTAAAVELVLKTPTFTLPLERPAVLALWLWTSFEPTGPGGAFDGLEVGVRRTDAAYTRTVWSTRDREVEAGEWVPVLIDLAMDAGSEVSIWLTFSTGDGTDNDHEGVYVGLIEVASPCGSERVCGPDDDACSRIELTPVETLDDALCVVGPNPPGQLCEPCTDASSCTVSDACDTASCDEGQCMIERIVTPECCVAESVLPTDGTFDTSDLALEEAGWTFEPPGEVAGHWHLSELRAFEGLRALRFGVPGEVAVAPDGQASAQVIWSPPMQLPESSPEMTFELWLSTEWDDSPSSLNPAGIDRFSILVRRSGSSLPPVEIWSADILGGTTLGAWATVAVPLDLYAGLDVELGFVFETGDEAANNFEGPTVDSLKVARRCPPPD